jgi:hypothetical protein
MGHLVTGAIVITIYFLLREYFIKRSFIKSAMILAERLNTDELSKNYLDIAPGQETSFYLLHNDYQSFKSMNTDKTDLLITELQYNDLVRFKRLIDNSSNNELSEKEFFTHNSQRHLVFPFKSNSGKIKVILLEKAKVSLDDLLNRNPRKQANNDKIEFLNSNTE